jgi:ABC-type nitrate/sulfonate/bicarbonate transport system permease component
MMRRKNLSAVGWAVGVVAVWEIAALALSRGLKDPMAASKLPLPQDVAAALARNGPALIQAAGVTFSKAAVGFAFGALVGYLLAVLMSVSKTMERIAFPYLIVSQMIPVLGLAPIIFNLVRNMDASRIVIAAYITFFPVAANALSGFKSVDIEKRQLMHSYATGLPTIYGKLMLPYSLPYLFAGLKIAAPMSVTASILVDMLGSRGGIGVKLLYSLYGGETDLFWASVLSSAAMGIFSYLMVLLAERVLLPWEAIAAASAGRSE